MRKKFKVARYSVSLNEMQLELLTTLMKTDASTDVSSYFGYLIAQEHKARSKRVGRPKNEDRPGIDDVELTDEEREEFRLKHFSTARG